LTNIPLNAIKHYPSGNIFKEERTYFNLSNANLAVLETPKHIIDILDKEDYYCPDYRQRLCF
jgi:hypothetical protein